MTGTSPKTVRVAVLLLVCLLLSAARGDRVSAEERSDLKERFRARYRLLVSLKDSGKVGEASNGTVQAVRDSYYLVEISDPSGRKLTIREFLAAENRDRQRLYRLIAAETNSTPAVVAVHNARRQFERARPHHYLRRKDGTWVQKRHLKRRQ